jgi:hypothetical protein
MKISQLSAKPQLIELQIDDEETVKQYGEPVSVWTWDRQPLETFMKLASIDQANPGQVIDIVRTLILDENGKPVIRGEEMLPMKLLMKIIQKIVDVLGK